MTAEITDDLLVAGMSSNGAWNYRQLHLLGVEFPLKRKWRRRLLGKKITAAGIDEFLRLKNAHLKKGYKQPQKKQKRKKKKRLAKVSVPVMSLEDKSGLMLLCESPIERQLLQALFSAKTPIDGIVPQHHVGPYRLDFAVMGEGMRPIGIECDGHDFHEKTKEQAARDKRRDRYFVGKGWRILRFTGSEIYKSPQSCVREIIKLAVTK